MKGLLADANCEGYVDRLVARMRAEPWSLFWEHLRLCYYRFADVGLAPKSPDALVWETCQRMELFLITDNRNRRGPTSLESTIRRQNSATSLPVFTIGDLQRLGQDRDYTGQVIERLLDYLMEGDDLRGTGRLYLP